MDEIIGVCRRKEHESVVCWHEEDTCGAGECYNVAYYILVEEAETEDGVLCDQYGLRVVLLGSEGKQSASVRQITTYPDSIYRLAQEVMNHLVTPAALQDVVDDWLAAV